jgi:hypothetical protein
VRGFPLNFYQVVSMLASVWAEIVRAARQAPAMYFAPLVGAVRGIRDEYRRLGSDR